MDKQPRIIPHHRRPQRRPHQPDPGHGGPARPGLGDPAELITHRVGFSDMQNAYDMYEQREDGIIKVVMDINLIGETCPGQLARRFRGRIIVRPLLD